MSLCRHGSRVETESNVPSSLFHWWCYVKLCWWREAPLYLLMCGVWWCCDHAAVDTHCPAPPRRRRRPAQFTMGGGCSSNKYFYSGHQIFLCPQLQSCSWSCSVDIEIDGNRSRDLQSCQCVQIALNIFIVGNNLDNKGVRDCSFSCSNLKYFLQCQVSVRTFVSSADIFCDCKYFGCVRKGWASDAIMQKVTSK